jgi:hypothetical protein
MEAKKIKFIFVLVILTSTGCTNNKEPKVDAESNQPVQIMANDQFHLSNEFHFKGGIILLEEKGVENEDNPIQEITIARNDIKYRAKKIPTALYLKNKGLEGKELEEAVKEVNGEQLFYFEFEEKLKQDLIKKYFEDNLDQQISYMSFEIYNDFKLINSKGDTINSDYSLYERNFHVAPYERILLSFSGVDPDEEVQLIYKDNLFGKGKFDFQFASASYIKNNIKNPS